MFIERQWHCAKKPDIYLHEEGYFIIRFESVIERDRILSSGPYSIANRPTILKPWSAVFCFKEEVLRDIPLWIKLPKLPLNCWGIDSLSRIGSTIGTPIMADECTTQQSIISYARILVEVDVTKPKPECIWVEGPDGTAYEQRVLFD